MPFIDIKKLKTVEECDMLILQLMQQAYKDYLDSNDGIKTLQIVIELMKKSKLIDDKNKRRERIQKRLNTQQKNDIIHTQEDADGE